ncbi:hypothetical protein T08_6608 [Trichinella sp. T8]|nr:hypothetical protein T08_6608 [Trichinella sp. T8]
MIHVKGWLYYIEALTLTNNQYRRYQFEEMKRRRTSGANDGRAGYFGYEVGTGVYSFY